MDTWADWPLYRVGRGNGLGQDEWRVIAPAVAAACPALADIRDFEWSRAILSSTGNPKLDLSGRRLGRAEAAVLGALLPRVAATVRDLAIRLVGSAPACQCGPSKLMASDT